MILSLELEKNKRGKILNAESDYKPSDEVKGRLRAIVDDFGIGYQIQQSPQEEFDGMNVLERANHDQKAFNNVVVNKNENSDEAWRSNAVRPVVRNRTISIAAHVTGSLIFPQIFAQNDADMEDKDAGIVMRDLMEWAADQSDYERTFLYGVISALVNPAVIMYTEYGDVLRTIKDIQEDGTWIEKEVVDDEYSGFKNTLVPVDELYIGDIREHNIQRQPFLIWRRVIDYSVAKAKYGHLDNFKYISPGIQHIYIAESDTFYEQWDDELGERYVEEVIYWNRSSDLKIPVVNGVLISDSPDQPNPRNDKMYPFAKSGYELIDEGKFFYYKSLAFKMAPDEEAINTLYRMVIDGTYLDVMPPTAIFGDEEIGASVIAPGSSTVLSNDTKVEPLRTGSNLISGFNMMDKIESSLSETSNDVLQSGQGLQGNQTAFEISRLEQNARTLLGMFGKMIGFLVKDFGVLVVGDIVQFLTVGEVGELTGENGNLKFRNFLIPERVVDGKSKTRKIEFSTDLPEGTTSEESILDRSFGIMDQEEKIDSDMSLLQVNPKIMRKMKYLIRVTPDIVTPPSENVRRALNLEQYDRAIANPLADQEAIFKDLLLGSYGETRDDPDKYIVDQPVGAPGEGASGSPLAKVLNTSPGDKVQKDLLTKQ